MHHSLKLYCTLMDPMQKIGDKKHSNTELAIFGYVTQLLLHFLLVAFSFLAEMELFICLIFSSLVTRESEKLGQLFSKVCSCYAIMPVPQYATDSLQTSFTSKLPLVFSELPNLVYSLNYIHFSSRNPVETTNMV